jgi:hypothetical protein
MKNAVLWMWLRVDLVSTDVSEEHIASIFRVENLRARNQGEQVADLLVNCYNNRLLQRLRQFFLIPNINN